MSGETEKTEHLTSLLHKTITASNAYAKGCDEKIVNEISDGIKVGHVKQLYSVSISNTRLVTNVLYT